MCNIMSSENSEFFFFLLVWISFISFPCLIGLTGTSRTMLNKSGESAHLFLVPDLRGKPFSFSPLRMLSALHVEYEQLTAVPPFGKIQL